MRWWALALSCVAACGGQGLDIEVHADAPFDAVELYIAYDTCRDCGGVAWPNATQSTDAESVYLLKGDEKVVRTTDLVGDNAVIHLEAADGFEQTTAIAIVGYKAGEIMGIQVLYDKQIPRDDQEKWLVDLRGITRASTDVSTSPKPGEPAYRALAWPREQSPTLPDPTGYASCLAYQEWQGDSAGWKTQFFVPETDTDCDGTPPDCDPLWAHRPLGTAKCVSHPSAVGLTNACVVGTKTCIDETSAQACTPSTTPLTCIPNNVCDLCKDADNLLSCFKGNVPQPSMFPTMSAVPMLVCPFITDPNSPTTNGPCIQSQFNAEHMTFAVPGVCDAANAVLRPLTAPFSGGAQSMLIGGTALVSVHATAGTSTCSIGLDWTEGEGQNPQTVLLALQFGAKQVLIPVYIGFKNNATCPASPQPCMQLGNWPPDGGGPGGDSLFDCTR